LRNRERYNSVKKTLGVTLAAGLLPIINENDAVSTEDLRVGDNDNLSAAVAAAVDAQLLVVCTDVDGLYTKNPRKYDDAELIREVDKIDARIKGMSDGLTSTVGTGGMQTKIEAAEKAVANGITTMLINGFDTSTFTTLLEGGNPGTVFMPNKIPIDESEHWRIHVCSDRGKVIVNEDFVSDFDNKSQQVGCDQIVGIRGRFAIGDTVLVCSESGRKLAKASTRYSSCLLDYVLNREQTVEAEVRKLGPVVNRDSAVFY
jgi:glutamate 5-kinase